MKIRNGFVSNSSSSSFCIYGTTMDVSDFEEMFKAAGMSQEDFDDLGIYEVSEILEGYGDYGKKLKSKIPKNLETHIPEGSDSIYIGRSWDSVGDNETGKEFKKDVEASLKELVGKKVDCNTHSESWYNG